MLLAIDVGNTNIVIGVYDGSQLVGHWRIGTDRLRTSDEYGIQINSLLASRGYRPQQVSDAVVSTVVPPITGTILRMCQRYFEREPLLVTAQMETGLTIRYDNPAEVGADRIVNAVAAYHLFGGPLIIIDFGTATTFCAVSRGGEYLGGAIAPGIVISAEALYQRAARLPRIELVRPQRVIARSTVASMQAGIVFGYAGLVKEIVERMKQDLPGATVVATGGLAQLVGGDSRVIDRLEPFLTLEGLRIIHQLNRRGR
ncbi:MAG: type III pantothenate kinase [Negativicutes bacterium]|nr:type III pantothenate kinase [Negativicutes bacterium]